MTKNTMHWLWVLPLILVMSALVVPRLGYDGLWLDEWYSVRNSGGALYGPLSAWGIIQRVVETDSTQALGYPLLFGSWGWFAGWTAFAGRVSSWLVGTLTIAMGFRLGHLVLGKRGGVYTALALSVSAFFVYFSHELRAYMLMAFFCCALVWAYIHLLQARDGQARWVRVVFVLSGAGLLWAHYYSAILLIGLALYHLLFAPKNKSWWELVGLAVLVSVTFLPQVPGFLRGFQTYEPSDLGATPLTSTEVVQTLLYYGGNGWGLVTVVLLALGMWFAVVQRRRALGAIILLSVATITVLVVANATLEILEPRRMRYAVVILPLCCVWIAGGMVAIEDWLGGLSLTDSVYIIRIASSIVPFLWLVGGLYASSDEAFTDSLEAEPIPRFRELVTAMDGHIGQSDLLALYAGDGGDAFYIQDIFALATHELVLPRLITSNVFSDETRSWAVEQIAEADRVWYAVNRTIPENDIHTQFLTLLDKDFEVCSDYVDADDIGLTLWVRDGVFCPDDEAIVSYGTQFALASTTFDMDANRLVIKQGWQIAPQANPQDYSLGVFVVNPATEAIVLQADMGFPMADFFAVTQAFENVTLPAGEYDIRVVVYAWETGSRLDGEATTGAIGNYLTIDNFAVLE